MKIPEKGKIYSFNEGNYNLWNDDLRAYIEHVKDPAAHNGKPYSGRYIGSLVSPVLFKINYFAERMKCCRT